MFLVGGGILVHSVELLHHTQIDITHYGQSTLGGAGEMLAPLVFDGLLGVFAGLVIVIMHVTYTKLFKTHSSAA